MISGPILTLPSPLLPSPPPHSLTLPPQAREFLLNLTSNDSSWPGPLSPPHLASLRLCDPSTDWPPPKQWRRLFDAAVGPWLAEGRKEVEEGTRDRRRCEQGFEEVRVGRRGGE